jgi:5-methylcytosine-specific restriction endonuclease McrA
LKRSPPPQRRTPLKSTPSQSEGLASGQELVRRRSAPSTSPWSKPDTPDPPPKLFKRKRRKRKESPPGTQAKHVAWLEAREGKCRVCGSRWKLQGHHTLYRQHLRAEGADEWDLRGQLTVCGRCHRDHHAAVKRIPVSALRDDNIVFALDLLGERAIGYIGRYYFDDGSLEERLDAATAISGIST